MNSNDIQVGSTITNGSSALRITERVQRDVRWGTSGWRGMCIPTEQFGGNPGMSDFIPDYLLSGWRHVPFEWTPCVGGQVEERYVWAGGYRWLQREVRRVPSPEHDGADELLASLRPTRLRPDVCMLPACGCNGEAHP